MIRGFFATLLPAASMAAPLQAAAAIRWPLNPATSFLGLYFGALLVATPTAALAAFARLRGAAPSARQRMVDASIWMVAAGAALGWALLAVGIYGDALRLRIGLTSDGLMAVAVVPPALALASGPVALVGRGRGRVILLGGFGLMLLAVSALVVAVNQPYTGPAPSF